MLKVYPAIFHEENGYWVSFPNIEGCFSDGDTLDDAMENAQEALALHLSALLDDDIALPAPSPLEAIRADDGIIRYVGCDPNKYRRKTNT